MFKIVVTKFTFDFSDMLAFFLAIFAIGICSLFYVKVNEALQAFGAAGKSVLPLHNENKQVIVVHPFGARGKEYNELLKREKGKKPYLCAVEKLTQFIKKSTPGV